MSSEKKVQPNGAKKRTALRLLGALVGILLIVVLLRNTDLHSLLAQIRSFGGSFFIVIAVTFFSQLVAVYAWKFSFPEPLKPRSITWLFGIRLVGESLAQINPTNIVAGETLKMILMKRIFGTDYRSSGLSILLSRVMMLLAAGFLLFVGAVAIFQVFDLPILHKISVIICLIVGVLFLYIFFMLRKGHGVLSVFAKGLDRLLGRIAFVKKGISYLLTVDADMVLFYKKKKMSFYSVFALSILNRLVGSLEYFVILNALNIDVSLFTCVLFDVASTIIRTSGFFIPGQVGLEEVGNKLMFSLVKVPGAETWLTVSLIRRARQVFWIAAGFVLYLVISRVTGKDFSQEGSPDEDTLRNA